MLETSYLFLILWHESLAASTNDESHCQSPHFFELSETTFKRKP